MLSLDTETTGKDPHTAELVSVSVVEYRCERLGVRGQRNLSDIVLVISLVV
jgi:DNA polymerase III epsilon subunit-like protein